MSHAGRQSVQFQKYKCLCQIVNFIYFVQNFPLISDIFTEMFSDACQLNKSKTFVKTTYIQVTGCAEK